MISHRYKCVFLHISKCGGSTVEGALGVDWRSPETDYAHLFGWSEAQGIYLQHATPDQLIGGGWIDRATWDSYYKFVVVRNPWDRAYSDYFWVMHERAIVGSFEDFLQARGVFEPIFSAPDRTFRGDHLYAQSRYFTVAGQPVEFDRVVRFETMAEDLAEAAKDLGVPADAFTQRLNVARKPRGHYSRYYTQARIEMVREIYGEDIRRFGYEYEERKRGWDWIWAKWPLLLHPDRLRYLRLRFPRLHLRFYDAIFALRRLNQIGSRSHTRPEND